MERKRKRSILSQFVQRLQAFTPTGVRAQGFSPACERPADKVTDRTGHIALHLSSFWGGSDALGRSVR